MAVHFACNSYSCYITPPLCPQPRWGTSTATPLATTQDALPNYPSTNVSSLLFTTSPQRQLEKEEEEEECGGGPRETFNNRDRGFPSEGCVQCVSVIHKRTRTRTRTCTHTRTRIRIRTES